MDILSNLAGILGQGGATNNRSASGGGMVDSNMLGSLVGALFSGRGRAPAPSSTTGAQSGGMGELGGIGSILGSLLGGSAGGMSGSGAGGLGGLGGLLGSLMGGQAESIPPPPVPRNAPAPTQENVTVNMLRALVYAARADGRVDASEQAAIQDHIKKVGLGNQAQAFIDQTFREPVDPNVIARNITSSDEAMNIYVLTCAVTGLDDPREQQYAQDLANALQIPVQAQQAVKQRLGVR